jgi:hypothetical protein
MTPYRFITPISDTTGEGYLYRSLRIPRTLQ